MNERKMTLGFNCKGTEAYFEQMLRKAINDRTTAGFRYCEVGIAEGTTLISVATLLRETLQAEWQAVGIDLFDGAFFNERQFIKRSLAFNVAIEFEGRRPAFVDNIFDYDIVVALLKGETRATVFENSVNFALIDGCHGAPCVEKDFLAIEPGIAKGGIVAFHDAGEADQGIHFQQHCQMPISVRKALDNLQLPGFGPPQARDRSGWKFIGSIDGDKSPGDLTQNGHGFVFFQKI
jgi:hypothetical protein